MILKLLFADDSLCPSRTHERNHVACGEQSALTISLKKTALLHQRPPNGDYIPSQICIGDYRLNTIMGHFRYLGSVVANDATVAKDVDSHLEKANSSLAACRNTHGKATQ